jgi:hypothetical protein
MSQLIQLLWVLWLARAEARSDFGKIKNGLPIDHVNGWLWRAGGSLALALALAIHAGSWWMLAGLALVSYGAFTPLFRYTLNKLRGLSWHYVSLSNHYDTVFIELAGTRAGQLAYAVELIALVLGIYITTL